MAEQAAMLAAFTNLGQILQGIIDQTDGLVPAGPAETRGPPEDFIAAYSPKEIHDKEELRHKSQLLKQRVDFAPCAPPTAGSEPRRVSRLDTTAALKALPNDIIAFANGFAFDTTKCSAAKNIELFKLHFPGELFAMLVHGTYEDFVRRNSTWSKRLDHTVERAKTNTPHWSVGPHVWTHHGVEYRVSTAFVAELDRLMGDANGMRGNPWTGIHETDPNFGVNAPSREFQDFGCYDQNGPAVLTSSPQPIAHNTMSAFQSSLVGNTGYDPNRPLLCADNLASYRSDELVPYFKTGVRVKDIVVYEDDGTTISALKHVDDLYALLPTYVINDAALPPPCPCDDTGRPKLVHNAWGRFDDAANEFLLLEPHTMSRSKTVAAYWRRWHGKYPFRAQPPSYKQHNSEYRPDTVITRLEYDIFNIVIGTILKIFCEKKQVRTHDLDCIDAIRRLRNSPSYVKDIIDILMKEYPEDTTSIVSGYQRLFERVNEIFDGERMLPQYLINYLNEVNNAIERIGKPSDVFSSARMMDVFKKVFEDAYFPLHESQHNNSDYFRALNKLAQRFRRPENYSDEDHLKQIIAHGMERISAHLLNLSSEHNMQHSRPQALVFIEHGAPAVGEFAHFALEDDDDEHDAEEVHYQVDARQTIEQLIDAVPPSLLCEDAAFMMRAQTGRLANTAMARNAAARGGTTMRPPRGRGGAGRGGGAFGRGPARPVSNQRLAQRLSPYWTPTALAHPP